MTTTEFGADGNSPAQSVSKNDRIAAIAARIAVELPGTWTVGRGDAGECADLRSATEDIDIRVCAWEHREWGYTLDPRPPMDLYELFVWPRACVHPGFSVTTSPAAVARYLTTQLIPQYRGAIARARASRANRERRRGECREIEARVRTLFPPSWCDREWKGERGVNIQVQSLTPESLFFRVYLPTDAAVAVAPDLVDLLRRHVPDTDEDAARP